MCVRWLLHRKVQCEVITFIELCLFLSMVVWQPFITCWRYIIARVSEMHVAYHILHDVVVYLHPWNKQHSTSQTTSWYLSFSPSFLTCIVECVRVCRRRGGNSGRRVWLKMCVRWLLHRKIQCEVTLVIELCLFLSMVVWQPVPNLALNHCACLRNARRIS
jgi:hypothetical protein